MLESDRDYDPMPKLFLQVELKDTKEISENDVVSVKFLKLDGLSPSMKDPPPGSPPLCTVHPL